MDAEENAKLSLDSMPECVKQAQAEHEASMKQADTRLMTGDTTTRYWR